MYSYKEKFIRLNLSKKIVKIEEIPLALFKKYLGGRGIAAKIYYDEINPNVNPLEPENKIIFRSRPTAWIRAARSGSSRKLRTMMMPDMRPRMSSGR
ncbi:MAG: aldehyde ferredoxin oxidoreductase N-terminal domain-containing protein, partial [Nitrososphaerota archaeon]